MYAVMKLRKVGGSLGIIIPKDEIDRMHLKEGDELFGLPDDGGLRLQAFDPSFQLKLKAMAQPSLLQSLKQCRQFWTLPQGNQTRRLWRFG